MFVSPCIKSVVSLGCSLALLLVAGGPCPGIAVASLAAVCNGSGDALRGLWGWLSG